MSKHLDNALAAIDRALGIPTGEGEDRPHANSYSHSLARTQWWCADCCVIVGVASSTHPPRCDMCDEPLVQYTISDNPTHLAKGHWSV